MVVKLRTARIRSLTRRAREASEQRGSPVKGGPGTRACGKPPRSRSPARRASTRSTSRPRGRPVAASRVMDTEPGQTDLDDASDASIDPILVATASGAPSTLDVFGLEDQAVNDLERIETSAKAVEDDRVSDAIPAVPRLPPTPTQVHIRSEDRFDRHVYNAFVV